MEQDKFHCGPFFMPKFMRKWLSGKFNVACWIHDKGYEKDDGKRFKYDKMFLINMVKKSNNDRDVIYGITYYFFVRIFGGITMVLWRLNKEKNNG